MSSHAEAVDTIVTVVSWEPRFTLGIERTLERFSTQRVLAYFIEEYGSRTLVARDALRQLLRKYRHVTYEGREVSFGAPGKMWQVFEGDLGRGSKVGSRVLVDVTTMPREVIWSVLFWLEASAVDVRYVYNRPEKYAEDWLARDPNDPRLVYKLAGTLEIGRPTALVAVTGFDENRCRQAVEFYEPVRILVATQRGDQYGNDVRNVGSSFGLGDTRVERIEVDAFCEDHGYGMLRKRVGELCERYNVILCSFGPKPSAIALFRLQRELPETALAYIGCKEYNPEYSSGLGSAITGVVATRGTAR